MGTLNKLKHMISKKISRSKEALTTEDYNTLHGSIKRIEDVEVLHQDNFTVVIVEGNNFNRVVGICKRNPVDGFSVEAGINLALARAADSFLDEIYVNEVYPYANGVDLDMEQFSMDNDDEDEDDHDCTFSVRQMAEVVPVSGAV